MYSHRVLEQFQNSRYVGELPDADAYAQMDNPVCGDMLLLSIKLSNGRIADARFRVRGCVAAIACAAELVEMILKRSPVEASALRAEDIVRSLGGIPEASHHASQLAIDALSVALKQL